MSERWIDVSAHNCRTSINWPKVAASGIKGAIIRAGYGNSIKQQDTAFTADITGAIAAGLKVAIYYFSYADSASDALKEWAACRQIIAPYRKNILFVCYDYEYDSVDYFRRIHGAAPSKALINQTVDSFLSAARADGWKTTLYTNNDYRRNVFTGATLTAWDYLWLADYTGGPDIPCAIQQTTSSGSVPGISGRVDLDTVFVTIGGTRVKIDTTMDVSRPPGEVYTFKTVCPQQPAVSVGTAGVVSLMHCRREMDADYYHLFYIGKPGSEAGIYTAAPGEQPLKRFVAKII